MCGPSRSRMDGYGWIFQIDRRLGMGESDPPYEWLSKVAIYDTGNGWQMWRANAFSRCTLSIL